jgi:hypothetical protein
MLPSMEHLLFHRQLLLLATTQLVGAAFGREGHSRIGDVSIASSGNQYHKSVPVCSESMSYQDLEYHTRHIQHNENDLFCGLVVAASSYDSFIQYEPVYSTTGMYHDRTRNVASAVLLRLTMD